MAIAKEFFEELFTSSRGSINTGHIVSRVNRYVTNETNVVLTRMFTKDEIVEAVKDMGPIKAPSLDRFPTLFF